MMPGIWIRHLAHFPRCFNPPQGWEGDHIVYLDWLRSQFKSNHCFRQRLGSAARSVKIHSPVKIDGPYRDILISVLNSLNKQKKSCYLTKFCSKPKPNLIYQRSVFLCLNYFERRVFSQPFALINARYFCLNRRN